MLAAVWKCQTLNQEQECLSTIRASVSCLKCYFNSKIPLHVFLVILVTAFSGVQSPFMSRVSVQWANRRRAPAPWAWWCPVLGVLVPRGWCLCCEQPTRCAHLCVSQQGDDLVALGVNLHKWMPLGEGALFEWCSVLDARFWQRKDQV